MRHDKESALSPQLSLHRLTQIADQMKAIGDLTRVGRATANALGIRAEAIPANGLNARACREPRGDRGGGARG